MRLACLTAVLLLFAGAAVAQPIDELPLPRDRAQGAPPGERDGPNRPGGLANLFISPMGEPFRGPEGFAAWFAKADADHDGRITPAEFQADAASYFKALDKNGDGKLDGFELQAWERDDVPEIGGAYTDGGLRMMGGGRTPEGGRRGVFGFGRDDRGARGREGAGRFGLLDIPQPVQGSDRDADRRVSRDEWTKTAAVRFDLLDTTKAGVLTLATLPPLPGRGVALNPGEKPPAGPSGSRKR